MCTIKYKRRKYKIGDSVVITNPSTSCFRNIPVFKITKDSRVIYDNARKEKCIIISNAVTNDLEAAIDIRKIKDKEVKKLTNTFSEYEDTSHKLEQVKYKLKVSYAYEHSNPEEPFVHYFATREAWRNIAKTTITNLTNKLINYEQILCMYR